MTAADSILEYFFHRFSEKIRLDISFESSARQKISHETPGLIFFKR